MHSSALPAGVCVRSTARAPHAMSRVIQNWANTHSVKPRAFHTPEDLSALRRIVAEARQDDRRISVIGAGHSPNACAMCPDIMISLDKLNRIIHVDKRAQQVEAGIRLRDLHAELAKHGLAFPNLGSISDQSLAGAMATGTHGTGANFQLLSSCVLSMKMLLSSGEVVSLPDETQPGLLEAALCSLGCLGIIVEITLQVCPAFDIQVHERHTSMMDALANWRSRAQRREWYRFWWFPHTDDVWEWSGTRVPPQTPRPAKPEQTPTSLLSLIGKLFMFVLRLALWPIQGLQLNAWERDVLVGYHLFQAALAVTLVLPKLLPWVNRAWRVLRFSGERRSVASSVDQLNFDCLFQQHVDEWAIPAEHTMEAMFELRDLIQRQRIPAHFPVEVRCVRGDDTWMSPAYGRDSVYIGVIMYKPYGLQVQYREYFDEFEKLMAKYGGRPHWAKQFCFREPDFAVMYPKWRQFKEIRRQVDHAGMFANPWVQEVIIGEGAGSSEPWMSSELRAAAKARMEQADGTVGVLLNGGSARQAPGRQSGSVADP